MAPLTVFQLTVADVSVIADEARPVGLGHPTGALIVKFVFEMSKKILLAASTFILLVVPGVDGTVITCVPSLAVAAANTVGKVFPPSVDNKIFTLLQLTGLAVVLFTFHVTVAAPPPLHVIFVFGEVTWKGPEVLLTVTTTSVNAVWPTATGTLELNGWLSLTVSLKFNVLETELNASMLVPASPPGKGGVTNKPERMVDNLGKVLVGDTAGLNDNQLGPVAFVGEATLFVPDVVELSFCSQQYVSASPLASVAAAVSANGVLIGIV